MNILEKEFVPYEQALSLKELGFNEPCMAIYYSKDKSFSWHHHVDHTNDEPVLDSGEFNISAPTFSQAFRWFREKYGCLSYIDMDNYSFYRYTIYKGKGISEAPFDTYEEAELACLDKLIKIVKDDNTNN